MSDYDLKKLCELAKKKDEQAIREIIEKFEPLIYKSSYIDGNFDDDCVQELKIKVCDCIEKFEFNIKEDFEKYL